MAFTLAWPKTGFSQTIAEPINLTPQGFTKSTLKTPAGEMTVFESGQGEPLLLLHGVGAGASSFIWHAIAPELAKHYRVIAPDFVGWGESEHPARPVLFDDYVQQITALGQWINQPVKVVTQSVTSGFVIAAMQKKSIDVSRLSLHAPSGGLDFGIDAFGEAATQNFARIAESPQRKEVYKQIFHQRPAVEDWYRNIGFLDPEACPEEIIEAGVYNARQPNASYSALPFLSGKLRYDIAPLLREVTIPTLMIWGESEIQINAQLRQKIEQVNPKIEVVRINKARSTFEIEQPEQTLNVLLAFLKGND